MKQKVVAVSGGMDCLHLGHINLIREAKKLGDKLVVILNNDNWLRKKKGFVFIRETERVEIIKALKYVDDVIITTHESDTNDMSVCKELEILRPDIFANGGDRAADNIPEYQLCQKLGIEMVFNVGGGKIASSSDMLKKVLKNINKEE